MSDSPAPSYPAPASEPAPTGGDAASDSRDEGLPRLRGARPSTLVALFLVIAIGGGALFVSGFALGHLAGATPGTTADNQDLFRPFWDAYNDISANYVGKVDQHLLVEGAIGGLFTALGDPFSQYLTEEQYRQSLSGISGETEGVGVQITTRDAQGQACDTVSDTCQLVIVHVVRNSPALRAGLQENDVIVAIDGTSTAGMTVDDVAGKLRGPKGTSVSITVDRAGTTQEFSVTRDVIQREDVQSDVLADGRVGYLKIAGFSSGSSADFHNLLDQLVNQDKVQAIVLDLRDDPGGYVDAAQKIASEFVADKPLYYEQTSTGDPMPQQPIAGGVATNPAIPVVVLVNGGTASASEIVSAAIQGNERGQLVGSKTYGKGTIQEFKELTGAGGYRLSVRKWLTPDLTWIHGVGLMPDVDIEPPADQPADQDLVLDKGIEVVLDELDHPSASPGVSVAPAPSVAPSASPPPAAGASASPAAMAPDPGVLELSLAWPLALG
jgi:carboxyl-terminal processing protease